MSYVDSDQSDEEADNSSNTVIPVKQKPSQAALKNNTPKTAPSKDTPTKAKSPKPSSSGSGLSKAATSQGPSPSVSKLIAADKVLKTTPLSVSTCKSLFYILKPLIQYLNTII